MGKAAAARKLASAAALGGGGLSVLGAGLYGVLRGEAALARRMIGNADDPRFPDSTGWYGRGRPGPAIEIALLGDSSAAGYGVERIVDTPGAFFASGLAAGADRLGVAVPGQLSVVGFDDIESAAFLNLSTIRQPLARSGTEGAQRLCALLRGDRLRPLRQELPIELMARGTSARAQQ